MTDLSPSHFFIVDDRRHSETLLLPPPLLSSPKITLTEFALLITFKKIDYPWFTKNSHSTSNFYSSK